MFMQLLVVLEVSVPSDASLRYCIAMDGTQNSLHLHPTHCLSLCRVGTAEMACRLNAR